MSFLRGKEEPNFTDSISKTKLKWDFLHSKMLLLERFLAQMQTQYDARRAIYNRYRAGLRLKDKKEYKEWEEFLREDQPASARDLNNSSFFSQRS